MMADSGQRGVAAEQRWRFGGRLYLADREALCRPDVHWTALRRERLSEARRGLRRACGFTSAFADNAGVDVAYRKGGRPPP